MGRRTKRDIVPLSKAFCFCQAVGQAVLLSIYFKNTLLSPAGTKTSLLGHLGRTEANRTGEAQAGSALELGTV